MITADQANDRIREIRALLTRASADLENLVNGIGPQKRGERLAPARETIWSETCAAMELVDMARQRLFSVQQ